MAKKGAKKTEASSSNSKRSEQLMMQNFVSLQKIMAELSGNFDKLAKQIAQLLELFEISAKTLAQKEIVREKESSPELNEITKKLETLIEQNRVIAKGLVMLHEAPAGEYAKKPAISEMPSSSPISTPAPFRSSQGYQKSIAHGS